MDTFPGLRKVRIWLYKRLPRKGGGNVTETPQERREPDNPDEDRYPSVVEGIHKLLDANVLPDGPAELVELRWQASGECTYRITPPRAEESEIGLLRAPGG